VGDVRPDVHQVLDAVAAAALCDAFEEFSYLEEKHYEYGLGEGCPSTGKEADEKGTEGGDGHQEMLVEGVAVCDAFGCFTKGFVSDKEIWNKIDQEQLPGREVALFLYEYCNSEQYCRGGDEEQLLFHPAFLVFVVMLMMMLMVLVMMLV
jgi:hypothetical protein